MAGGASTLTAATFPTKPVFSARVFASVADQEPLEAHYYLLRWQTDYLGILIEIWRETAAFILGADRATNERYFADPQHFDWWFRRERLEPANRFLAQTTNIQEEASRMWLCLPERREWLVELQRFLGVTAAIHLEAATEEDVVCDHRQFAWVFAHYQARESHTWREASLAKRKYNVIEERRKKRRLGKHLLHLHLIFKWSVVLCSPWWLSEEKHLFTSLISQKEWNQAYADREVAFFKIVSSSPRFPFPLCYRHTLRAYHDTVHRPFVLTDATADAYDDLPHESMQRVAKAVAKSPILQKLVNYAVCYVLCTTLTVPDFSALLTKAMLTHHMQTDLHFTFKQEMVINPLKWYKREKWRLVRPLFLLYHHGQRAKTEEIIFADLPAELFRHIVQYIDPCEDMF